MKTFILVTCSLLSLSLTAWSQQFVKTFSVDLPDSAVSAKVEWVDLDNDGLLDVFTFATNPEGDNFLVTFKNDTIQGLINPATLSTGMRSAVYHLKDFDQDNDIDVIVSGTVNNSAQTIFFENQSDFKFVNHSSLPVRASLIRFSDVNADGKGDLIVSGTDSQQPFFRIYRFGNAWHLVHDSLKIEATSVEVFDFDGDSDNDLFVSGTENNVVVSKVLINEGGFYFKSSIPLKGGKGNTSVGDLNHDGRLDIFLIGVDASGQNISIQYLNEGRSFTAKDTLAPVSDGEVLLADFNSDGKCDIHLTGKTLSGDTVNTIALRDSVFVQLNKRNLTDQAFGDYDRDGDLDLLQVSVGSSSLSLQLSRNDVDAVNLGPHQPSRAFGFTIFNKLFLHWDRAVDDHTPSQAITYDVTLQTVESEILVGEFDFISNKRLTVSHGNTGTRNYLLLKPQRVSGFGYTVQSIDNSFESIRNSFITGLPGVCKGTGGPCPSPVITEVAACKNEVLAFTAEDDARWFSLSKGLLADGAKFEMKVVGSDTIFSFSPGKGCPSLKIYLISEKKGVVKKPTETRFVCEGQVVTLVGGTEWSTILWKSQLRGEIGSTSAIDYLVSQQDTIALHASNGLGCAIERKTALRISKPVVSLSGEIFQIMRGESVQLSASGGESYRWSPPESFDDSEIADPIVSPLSSTVFTVSVRDSIGCVATASVQVLVEGTAFVPNLFTPNGDGKNDEVKVYGLATASNFSFIIQNREGNIMYETNDVGQVSAGGWDGTSKGIKQPAGVYYWKVKGEHPSGRKLLLNGKNTGSIVLIR